MWSNDRLESNKKELREVGGIRAIVQCLNHRDIRILQDTTRVLRNLSFNGRNDLLQKC